LREKYIAPAAAALTLVALGATACGGAKPTCESHFMVSRNFPGDPKATSDQDSWIHGVEVDTDIPKDAKELDIGYSDPGGNWHDEWLPAEEAGRIAMKIGPVSVRFRTRLKAAAGSPVCESRPDTAFTEKSVPVMFYEGDTVPDPAKFHPEPAH